MRIIVILSALLCFLISLAISLLFYPIRIRIQRNNDVFRADLRYLFLHINLHDSAHPVDIDEFSRSNFRKKIKKLKKKQRQMPSECLNPSPVKDGLDTFFRFIRQIKLYIKLWDLFGKSAPPRLHIRVRRFLFTVHTESPADTAVLSAFLESLLYASAALIGEHFRLSLPDSDFLITPAYFTESDLSFDIIFSLPAIHYVRIFGFLPPSDDHALKVLEKRKQKQR